MTVLPHALTRPMKAALARWFAKRAPKSDSATLNLRNVYIFFSREGMLFALLLVITFIAGINYGNNLVLGLCFYLVSVWLISFHVTFAHISGLQVRLLEVTMAEAGEPVWVTLQLRSDSRHPRRQLAFSFEPRIGQNADKRTNNRQDDSKLGNDAKTQVLIPRLQDEQIIRLAVPTYHRGQLELPRLQIKTVYPLGIMRAWSYVYFARTAWVTPKPETFEWQAQYLVANSDDLPTGGQYTQGQDDFERLDNYIEGESLARVSWAHVARGQGMFTKHFADPVGYEQTLDYADMPAAHHEQKLSQLAYGALTLGQLGVPFQMQLPHEGLTTATTTATIGQGDLFAQACLLRLAKIP
ncbi:MULTISPECIES: DUF58 domain-containing protein [Psychrobacter]|uniref:DUF58 domain-containing protein n=1 Tax=Psychrobacter TaxID=497 RepID=UPI00191B123B|nr:MULTISPECIES: hypothetical protein [Psychrobacter]